MAIGIFLAFQLIDPAKERVRVDARVRRVQELAQLPP
jgi:hypothetical protein